MKKIATSILILFALALIADAKVGTKRFTPTVQIASGIALNSILNNYYTGTGGWGTYDDLWRDPADGPHPSLAYGDFLMHTGTKWARKVSSATTGHVLQIGDDPGIIGVGTDNIFWGLINEASFSLSDVTTMNVSSTRHGFAPKYPNNTTTFLRGDGTYEVPPGTGLVRSGAVSADQITVWVDGNTVKGATGASIDSATGQIIANDLNIANNVVVGGSLQVGGTAIDEIRTGLVTFNMSAFNVNDSIGGISGTNPKQLTISGGGLTGVDVGDPVVIGLPHSIMGSGGDSKSIKWDAWVSAANTVVIQAYLLPEGSGAYDPPEGAFRVTVFHYAP